MKTLLLAGYRRTYDQEPPLGITLLDHRISQLRQLGHDVICVLSGPDADEQLRCCRRIADVELAFDTNDANVSLLTNIKAGLAAAEGEACFVWPVEIPAPPMEQCWDVLKEAWRADGMTSQVSLVQMMNAAEGAPWHYGFPLLITRFGNVELRQLEGVHSLLDARLRYLHVNVALLAMPNLAPAAKAL